MKFSTLALELSVAASVVWGAPVNTVEKAFFDWDATNFVCVFS